MINDLSYTELIKIKNIYEQTESEPIKKNIKRVMKRKKIKHEEIEQLLSISKHTAYSYTNAANGGKPELINLLILSSFFNIPICDLLTPYKA